jgi:hypothetical protein
MFSINEREDFLAEKEDFNRFLRRLGKLQHSAFMNLNEVSSGRELGCLIEDFRIALNKLDYDMENIDE